MQFLPSQKLGLFDTIGGVAIPAPPTGYGYVFFDNTGNVLANHPIAAIRALPQGNLALSVADANNAERPLLSTV